jgi:hypothetical protein
MTPTLPFSLVNSHGFQNKTWLFTCFFILFTLVTASQTNAQTRPTGQAPDSLQFSYPKDTLDLGSVTEGKTLNASFKFRNNYAHNIKVESIYPSCGCTTTSRESFEMKSGETKEIDFSILTTGMEGVIYKSIIVITDQGAASIHFKVNVNS